MTVDLSSRSRRRRLPLRGAAIVATGSVILFAGLVAATTYARRPQSAPVATHLITTQSTSLRTVVAQINDAARETERLSGTIEARHTATVAAEVAARVMARPIERGDRIRAGVLLAQLDDRTARANLAEAQAGLQQATAARKQAEAEYARAVIETGAAIHSAEATVVQATAGEQKARSFTRAQEMRQAEAALSQAETDENLAKIERDRYARLVAEGAVAQQTLDRTQATYDAAVAHTHSAQEGVSLAREGARQEDIAQATAQVSAARAGLASAQARPARLTALREQIAALRAQEAQAAAAVDNAVITLSRHRIVSPVSGRVLETRIEPGEMATPGGPVAVLADVRQIRAVFAVPEAARPLLHEGTSLTLTADALPGKSFPARATTLGYDADPKARTFRIELSVPNEQEILLPNMTVRLSLPVGARQRRVTIPVAAVATDEVTGESYVVLVTGETTTRRSVTLGSPIAGDQVVIASGLNGGETLAADPARTTIAVAP